MRTTSTSQSHSIVPSPTPTIAPSPEPQLELTTKGKPKLTLGNDEPASAKPVEREDLSPRAPSPPEGKDSKNTGTAVQESKHEAALADQTNLLPTRQVLIIFAGLSLSLFSCLIDQTIVSTALPSIGAVFGSSETSSWVATSYLLTSTCFQPLYGRFSDIFGRKIVLIFAITVFFFGSLGCALSQSLIQLIVCRAISGVGGGGILTCVMVIVSDIVSLRDRGKYQGILGVVVAASNSLGPLLGGVFTEQLTWRWCFWINLPLTAASALVVIFLLPIKQVRGSFKEKLKKVDYAGSLISLAATISLLIPISWGGTQYAWDSAAVLVPLFLGVALLGLFIWVELKVATLPIIPMHIFKNPTVFGVMTSTFLSGCVFYVSLYYLPQYFQVALQVSAMRSAVLLFGLIIPQTFFSFLSGFIVSKTGEYRYNLCGGFIIWSIGLGLISTLDEKSSLSKIVGYQILVGCGAGQTFQTGLIAAQAAVPRSQMAVVTATRNFVRLLGGTVALAICQALLNNSVQTTLRKAAFSPDTISAITSSPTSIPTLPNLTLSQRTTAVKAFVQGIRHVWYFTIPCAAISFFLVVGFVKHHSLNRGDDEAQRAQAKEWAARHKLSKEERKQQDMEKGVAVASSEKDARGVDGDEQAAEQKREETMAKRIEEEVTK